MEEFMICFSVIVVLKIVVIALFILVLYALYLNFIRYKKNIILFITIKKIKLINFWRQITIFLKKNSDIIRRASYPITSLIVAFLVVKFSGEGFTQDVLSNYLVATGAMTGGTIAIVFTISLFLLQNAANLYSSQYLEVYTHDWKERMVYFAVILITLILLGGGLFAGGLVTSAGLPIPTHITNPIVWASLFLIGIVFTLIDWQYKNVRQKISPTEAIIFLEKQGRQFIKKVNQEAGKAVGLLKVVNATISDADAFSISFNRIFDANYLDRQLENLVEISTKLAEKGEIQTTKRCYVAIHNILCDFFEAKKNTSVVLPVPEALLALQSDSQNFLSRTFERINKTGEKFIKDGMEENASYIVDIYDSLAKKSREINFRAGTENPILSQIASYLNVFIEVGQWVKNIEVVYQGARVLGNIASIAAEDGHQIISFGIQDNLFKTASFGLTEKQLIITDKCISSLVVIIRSSFINQKMVSSYHSDKSIKKLLTIILIIREFIKSKYIPNDYSAMTTQSKVFDDLYSVLVDIANHYFEITDDAEKRRYRRSIATLLKDIVLAMRQVAEDLKDCDSFVMNSIGRYIYNVNNLIIFLLKKDDFSDSEIYKWLEWNLNLPFWFVYHSEKFDAGALPFHELLESVVKTGILAYDKMDDKELFKECVDCVCSIAEESLRKTEVKYGLDEPRIFEKACFLGVLAMKKGWMDIVLGLTLKIREFETEFFKKYLTNLPPNVDPENHNVMGIPHKNQLYRELSNWRDEFEHQKMNSMSGLDDSSDMMYPLIDETDIDRFIFRVWSIVPSDSDIEDELLKELRVSKIRKIIRILKNRINIQATH